MRMKRLAMTVLILLLAAVAAGCSGSDENKDSMTITMDNGKTLELSQSEWPDNFPEDIPRPKEVAVTASLQNDSGSTTVSIETKKPFDELVKLYQEYAQTAGYAQTIEMKEDGYYMFSGSRGNEIFMFTFSVDQEDAKTVTGAIVHEIKA